MHEECLAGTMDSDHYSYLDKMYTVISNDCGAVAYVKTRVGQLRAFRHERQFGGQTDGSSSARGLVYGPLERTYN